MFNRRGLFPRRLENQKGVIHLLPLLLLAIGLVAGVYLVTSGNPLKLFSKAGGAPIFFMNLDGSPLPVNLQGVTQASSPTVKVGLSSTLGPPAPVSGPINSNTTVAYRGALNPADLQKSTFVPYTTDPTVITVEFLNKPGIQFYWVDFKSSSGKIDRKAAKIEFTTANPGVSPRSSCQPRPTCLDARPACKIPEPTGGWCASPSPSCTPVDCPAPPPNCRYNAGTACSCGNLICLTSSPSSIPGPSSTPNTSCQPRPACLDSQPRCLMPEPAEGWCPSSSPFK